ncbi:MAG: hypothetical protein K0Q53_1626 [Massilibacillus sp.]|nr:hypothetical protein [Massilibacillus sp.]
MIELFVYTEDYYQLDGGIFVDKNNWSIFTITSIFFIVQIVIMIALDYKDRHDYLRSVAGTTCFWIGYTFLEVKYHLKMNTYVRILIVLTIFFDALIGSYFDLYASSFIFDKVLHFFGSYAFSLFSYILVMQIQTTPIDRPVKFILVLCLGLSIGVSYEILEFITDSISHPVPPSQPSLLDTDIDLIGDLIGASLAGFHAISRKFINKEF